MCIVEVAYFTLCDKQLFANLDSVLGGGKAPYPPPPPPFLRISVDMAKFGPQFVTCSMIRVEIIHN